MSSTSCPLSFGLFPLGRKSKNNHGLLTQCMEVESRPPPTSRYGTTVKNFAVAYFLPLAFLVAVAFALALPLPGKVVGSWHVSDVRVVQAINKVVVFLISGLTLRTDHLKSALRRWQGTVYGLVSILLITPCLGFACKVRLAGSSNTPSSCDTY